MKVTKVVSEVLAHNPAVRNSDNRLILQVCERLGCEFTADQKEKFDSMPKVASIIRARARLQSSGRFLPAVRHTNKETPV